jgi:hypothetical protein
MKPRKKSQAIDCQHLLQESLLKAPNSQKPKQVFGTGHNVTHLWLKREVREVSKAALSKCFNAEGKRDASSNNLPGFLYLLILAAQAQRPRDCISRKDLCA